MCGIAGVLYSDPQRSVDPSVLQRMGDSIAHRGPDGQGYFRAGNVGLVHQRLAVIDLAGGQQPIGNEDGSLQVVFSGEIYNYRELRTELQSRGHAFRTNSDTEVLVHAFEEYGPAMCRRLRGMFAFALWSSRSRQLFLARDHLGQRPLYVYHDDEKLLFGSELKAILAHPNVDERISTTAIEDYLAFGFIPGDNCILSRVQKLRPAHWMLVSAGCATPRAQRFWQLSFNSVQSGSVNEWKERVDHEIRESVRAHLVADVPIGAFLSGGLDSSAIVATAAGLTSAPLRTFSIGFHEKRFSELPHAASVARHFGCHHTEAVVTAEAVRDLDDFVFLYDEPFADASAIPTMAASRLAAGHVKVVLSGDGGDELFAGYERYAHDLKEARLRALLPAWLRRTLLRRMAHVWPEADWLPRPLRLRTLIQNLSSEPAQAYANTVALCRPSTRDRLFTPHLRGERSTHVPERAISDAYATARRDVLSGMLSADTNVLLPDDFLTKVDRASMGFGLEVRPPMIDWRLMELVASMPSDLKIRHGSGKWILKQLFESRLPKGVAHRRKQGFAVPIDAWLRGPLRNQVQSVVLDSAAPIAEYIDVAFARSLFTAHCQRRGRHGALLWSMLVLGRWLNTWGSGSRPPRSMSRA